MKRLKSPLCWFGGKSAAAPALVRLLPPHQTYVEVFAGGASLLFSKSPSPVEVLNDLDEGLVGFYRVLRDPAQAEELRRLCELTPFSRAEFYACRDKWPEETDPVRRAWAWYVKSRMSFSGNLKDWGFSVESSHGTSAPEWGKERMTSACASWLTAIDGLADVHRRLSRVQVECKDWRRILDTYDRPGTFFFLDPPYVPETRRSGGYAHEMTMEDHAELAARLLRIDGMALLCGYAHPVYEPLVAAGWEWTNRDICCSATGRTRGSGLQGNGAMKDQRRTETIWQNPAAIRARKLSLFSDDEDGF